MKNVPKSIFPHFDINVPMSDVLSGTQLNATKTIFLKWLAQNTVTIASEGEAFTLASGRTSNYYLNLKPVLMNQNFIANVIPWIKRQALSKNYTLVSGMESAAIPLIASVCTYAGVEGDDINGFFIRKAPKQYGMKNSFEFSGSLEGQRVLILEDVVTTAGSSLRAIEAIREAGALVTDVVAVVDREEGGAQLLADHGITLTTKYRGIELLGALD